MKEIAPRTGWITHWARSGKIVKSTTLAPSASGHAWACDERPFSYFYEGRTVFFDREAAVKNVAHRLDGGIRSARKKLERLQAMDPEQLVPL